VLSEMSEVYGADSVSAVVPVHNTHTLDAAAAKYWQLAGQFEGKVVRVCDETFLRPRGANEGGVEGGRRAP